jgi:hypothetical protein
MSCGGDCVTAACDVSSWSNECVAVFDAYLACLKGADPSLFTCGGPHGIIWDVGGYYTCPDIYAAYTTCVGQAS